MGQPDEVRCSPLARHLCFVADVVVAVDCDTRLDDVKCFIHADTVLLARREFAVPRSRELFTIAQRHRRAERRVVAEQHLGSTGASQMRQVIVSEVFIREPAVTWGAERPIDRVGAAEYCDFDAAPKEVAAARDVHEVLGHRDRLTAALDLLLQKRVMLVVAVEERHRDARGGHGVDEPLAVGPVAEVTELEHHVGIQQTCRGRDEALPPRSPAVCVSNQEDAHPPHGAHQVQPRKLGLKVSKRPLSAPETLGTKGLRSSVSTPHPTISSRSCGGSACAKGAVHQLVLLKGETIMATLTESQNKIDMSNLELNTAIAKVRKDMKAAEAAIHAPMADGDIPAAVKREIRSVVGHATNVEVRFIAWETIEAHDVVLEDGTVVNIGTEDVQVYSVAIPGTKLKKGYKTYVRLTKKIDGPAPYIDFESAWFLAVPAMWRRVAFLPNSRSCYGTLGAYLQQWSKHKWNKRTSHAICVTDVYSFERFCR